MRFPRMFRVQQYFDGPRVDNITEAVRQELAKLGLDRRVSPGQRVAITAGSRGIANIALIIKSAVGFLKELGAQPFIVPAMGSHGGGTAEGQRHILESYGITEEYTGAEIRSSMDTVLLGKTPEGIPIYFDRHTWEADSVLVCGRVKPHTAFAGDIESGLMKMLLIGLGKHRGAATYHRAIQQYSFGQIVRSVAQRVLSTGKVLAGLAIVENAYDETALIAAVLPERFEEEEKKLLVLARQWMPRLPFSQVDVLIVDQMGKNISGSGMDTNVIGRKFYDHCAAPDEYPKVKRIFVRELTPETHGNACGIGIAEFCTSRLIRQTDLHATYVNVLTGGHPTAGAIPIHYESDREVLEVALQAIGLIAPEDARVIRIPNTLELGEVEISEAYLEEAKKRSDLSIPEPPHNMTFDEMGNLPPLARSIRRAASPESAMDHSTTVG